MCVVHLCSAHADIEKKSSGAVSSPQEELPSFHFWWDTAPEGENTVFCLSHWCHTHATELCQIIADFMQTMGREKVQGKEVQEWLCLDDTLSHWYTSLLFEKHSKILPHLFSACKIYAFTQLLKEYAPHCTTLVLHISDPLVQETLKSYCSEQGIQYILAPAAKTKKTWSCSLKKCFAWLPSLCQALLRFCHWLWILRPLLYAQPLPLCAAQKATKHVSIVSYFPHVHKDLACKNIFRSQYWEDLHTLVEQGRDTKEYHVHWLFIRVNSAQFSLKQSMKLKKNFQIQSQEKKHNESFYYAEEFLQGKDLWLALKTYITIRKKADWLKPKLQKSWRMEQEGPSLWPFFRSAWQESFAGWRCLERCLQQRALQGYADYLQKNLTDKAKYMWTLFPWENCPWERRLTEAMRTAFPQSFVYAAQHSSLRQTDFRYFDGLKFFSFAAQNPLVKRSLPHLYCLNGQHAVTRLQEYIPKEKLYHVEALRYTYLNSLTNSNSINSAYPVGYMVLITSYFSAEVHAQIEVLSQWWQENKKHTFFTGKIYIKAHPHLSVLPFLHAYGLNPHDFVCISETMQDFWQRVQHWHTQGEACLLWLANSTTVVLEAAYLGLPLCVQGAKNDFNLCPLDGIKKFPYIHTSADLQKALVQLPQVTLPKDFFFLHTQLSQWKHLALRSLRGIA